MAFIQQEEVSGREELPLIESRQRKSAVIVLTGVGSTAIAYCKVLKKLL
jgi:hypothetical protein